MVSISDLAKRLKIHRITLSRKFSQTKNVLKSVPLKKLPAELVLILDGTWISKQKLLSLAFEYLSSQPLAWSFDDYESYASWKELLLEIRLRFNVMAVVSDGQKGLRKAIKEVFPEALHQRCLAHVIRLSLAWLTRNPKTKAGEDLRNIILTLSKAKTKIEAGIWKKSFELWDEYYDSFLQQKSLNPITGINWFTHKKLRAVRSLIKNALPDLFWFLEDRLIPNTTNAVEGGINSPVSELLRRHRGITEKQKELLVSDFLRARRERDSSTRNAT